ncbi:hypothetical protein HK096_002991 [Nowakowskiella sp. JEL0078]|nr:hypothetical protein HK096_002991 [Nowakowskiella sp. JEL0078]
MRFNFRTSSGKRLELAVDDTDLDSTSLLALKQLLIPLIDFAAEPEQLRLIAQGRVLSDDNSLLSSFSLTSDTIIQIVKSAANVTASLPATPSPTAASPSSNSFGMPPEMMQGMIQMMTRNPEFMQSMLNSDPRMQQLMESHPEVRELLSDPNFMRQRMEEMMNPNLMNEAMRNQDRALSNIESMPGGMNYLQQMYRSMQGPLGQSSDPNPSTEEANRRFAQRLGVDLSNSRSVDAPNSEALPNPWASPTTRNSETTSIGNQLARTPATLSPSQGLLSPRQQSPNQFISLLQQTATQQQPQVEQSNIPQTMASAQMQFIRQMQQLQLQNNPTLPSLQAQAPLNPLFFSFGQPQIPQVTPATATQVVPEQLPENRYANELQLLKEMGFDDKTKCIHALMASGGNTDAAVAYLLDS